MSDERFAGRRNPHRLYRNPESGKLAGICAGIADYFGVDPWLVRGFALVALFFFPFLTIPIYLVLIFALPRRPVALYRDREEETLWREATVAPERTLQALKLKFRDVDARLARLEAEVTSQDFELRRDFRGLGSEP